MRLQRWSGGLSELGFTESRRLQLAVEQSRVTGFIHTYRPRNENPIAAVTRWKISPLPSELIDGLSGIGNSRWNVQLLKVRNGKPGIWQMEWTENGFRQVPLFTAAIARKRIAEGLLSAHGRHARASYLFSARASRAVITPACAKMCILNLFLHHVPKAEVIWFRTGDAGSSFGAGYTISPDSPGIREIEGAEDSRVWNLVQEGAPVAMAA